MWSTLPPPFTPMTCHLGAQSGGTSGSGEMTGPGNGLRKPCGAWFGKWPGERLRPARRSSIASRCRPRKKVAAGLRRWQTGSRTQTAHRGGHHWIATGRGGSCCQHPGSGRRQAGVGQTAGSIPPTAGDLGGCWLRGPTGVVGLGHGRLAADRGQAQTGTATTLRSCPGGGSGTHPGLAEPMPTVEQRL